MQKILSNLKFAARVLLLSLKRKLGLLKNIKYIFLALALFVCGFVLWGVLQKSQIVKPTIIEGVIGTYREEDLPDIVNNLLTESLINIDPSGKPVGNLISSWQVSDDGKTYIFHLKEDLSWSNGQKINASDLGIPLQDVSVKALDKNTLEFKLPEPFSPFPTLLDKPVFKKDDHLGLGPYTISKVYKDQIFVKKVILESKKENLPKIAIKFYPNEAIAKEALKLGDIQILFGISEKDPSLNQKNLIHEQKTNTNQIVSIFYNTQDPLLSDENLRLAMSFAAPEIEGETRAKSILPQTSWAFIEDVKLYLNNLEQSKVFLKKVENLDQIKAKPVVLTATNSLQTIGQKVVESWNKAGINSVLRVESGIPQNFQALLIAQNIPADPDQYSLWHSTQTSTNISKFTNPRVDKDLEDARKEKDINVRKEKYADFQKVLMDNAPATPLYFPKYNIIYMKKAEKKFKTIAPLQLPNFHN